MVRGLPMLLLAFLLAFGAGCGSDPERGDPGIPGEADEAEDGITVPTVPEEPNGDGEEASSCTNEELGYTIEYPGDWQTNDAEAAPACSYFDPDEIEVPEATEFLDPAVLVRVEPVELDQVAADDPTFEVLESEDTEIAGRRAHVREIEATGEGLLERGIRTYQYMIDLREQVMIVETHELEGADYERNRQVVDDMAGSLQLEETGS